MYHEAWKTHGSKRGAAKALGIADSTFRGRLKEELAEAAMSPETRARLGLAPGHFDSGVAPGFLMGKVTVQRNATGDIERTWERQSPSELIAQEAFKQGIADLVDEVRGLAPPVQPATDCDDDLLAVIPMGDPHFGMLSWARETGE